ncbi:MAG: hypothetical protein BGO69_11955 [Bacteroidetes bacterium 46-16]|nr:MAG: hypothetical protein BGO69_11955 [Bacteroidetes bacterium 46-16]
MAFDINEVLSNMLNAVKGTVKDNWSTIKDTANTFLQSRKERLDLLISLRLDNQISEELFQKRLADEQAILESELHSIAIISKAIAQQATNAAFDVLGKAVQAALGTIL